MSTFAITAPAGRNLVFHPARATLDAWHQMFGCWHEMAIIKAARAPHAGWTVAIEDHVHALATVHVLCSAWRRRSGSASSGSHSRMLPRPSGVAHNGDMVGRFAPSPTGELHVGNLRTAVAAAAAAAGAGIGFLVRIEDLDRVQYDADHERRQLEDLAAIGVVSDLPPVRQSDRFDLYRDAIATLAAAGEVYECFCSRREIRAEIAASASAPHAHLPDGAYPGTCRDLSAARRAEFDRQGRVAALRLRTAGEEYRIDDKVAGTYVGMVDDIVLQRNDGVPAYNLAVVVDDAAQGVTQVVRGDDLLSSTPRHRHLQERLGLPPPEYWHIPLVVDDEGRRLAKRFGAPSLADLLAAGHTAASVRRALEQSLGVDDAGRVTAMTIPRHTVTCADLGLTIPD